MLRRPLDCIFCLLNSRYKDLKTLGIEDANIYRRIIKIAERMDSYRTIAFAETFSIIVKAVGGGDPYKKLKLRYTRIAMNLIEKFRIGRPSEGLRLATLYNSFDTSVLGYEFRLNQLKDRGNFLIDESSLIDGLREKRIAYILDNAGEHVFDLKVIELLRMRGNTVDVFVRMQPYEIDVIFDDIKGINGVVAVEGNLPPTFMRNFKNYDLVISKGIANFEAAVESWTLGYDISNFLFAFKAKCSVLKWALSAERNDLIIATWRNIRDRLKLIGNT